MESEPEEGDNGLGASSEVAVVVPLFRVSFTVEEEISIRHLRRHLDRHPVVAISPQGLPLPSWIDDARVFEPRFFRSVAAYSRLLLTPDFYRAFSGFRYILIYQLDALVLGGDLRDWCRRGWDYVGAPWRDSRSRSGFRGVGNGGLSLRRIDAHLAVLEAGVPPLASLFLQLLRDRTHIPGSRGWSHRFVKSCRILREARRGSSWYANAYSLNEDRFWSQRAHLFRPDFAIPSVAEALAFAFESDPELAYEANGRRLPFGCHGWARYGREFWLPHLLPARGERVL